MAEACTLLKSVPVKSDQGDAVGNYVVDVTCIHYC